MLTFGKLRRSYRSVPAQMVGMRVESRKGLRRSGALTDDSGRVFLWSGASGSRKARRSRVVHRSLNPAFPGHQGESCWSGPYGRTTTMSDPAFGANVTRLFDPKNQSHYALSEDAQLELRMLFEALGAVAQVMDTPPGQIAPEVEPALLAPLFFTFAKHGQRILADAPAQFPIAKPRKSA